MLRKVVAQGITPQEDGWPSTQRLLKPAGESD